MRFAKRYVVSMLLISSINISAGLSIANALDLKGWFENLGKKDEKVSENTSSADSSQAIPPNTSGGKEVILKDTKEKKYIYREAKVPENERVSLPSSLQSKIDKTALDNIELSTLLAKGVKAKRGFTVNIKNTNNSGGKTHELIDCDALENGLLSCVSKHVSDYSKQSASYLTPSSGTSSIRSISAYGGLIPLVLQRSDSEFGTGEIMNISEILPNIKSLKKPYELDIIYSNLEFDNSKMSDIWMIEYDSKYKQTKCREPKSENSGSIPQIGEYKLLFCSQFFHEPDLSILTENGKYRMNDAKKYDNIYLDRILTSEQPDLSPFFSRSSDPVHIQFRPLYYFAEYGLVLPAEFFEKKFLPQKYQQDIFVAFNYWGPTYGATFTNDRSTTAVEFKLK